MESNKEGKHISCLIIDIGHETEKYHLQGNFTCSISSDVNRIVHTSIYTAKNIFTASTKVCLEITEFPNMKDLGNLSKVKCLFFAGLEGFSVGK
jgi:hypothetical protein